jgi:hypothetical protein
MFEELETPFFDREAAMAVADQKNLEGSSDCCTANWVVEPDNLPAAAGCEVWRVRRYTED